MANPLKQLAGQTVIYGLSTILARIINFLFVPIYTRLLSPESYGVVTEFMAYIAVLQVVLVLGLETGCFRFANKEGVDPKKVYSSAFVTVFCVSATFLALMIAFASPIASMLGYEGYQSCIMYMGGILALDAVTAILFAKLRQENKALKFAIFKTINAATLSLAVFVPMLTGTGGNASSQTSVTVIRGLSLGEIEMRDIFRVLWKELRVAVVCGLTVAAACFAKTMLVDLKLVFTLETVEVAAIVSATMFCAVLFAKLMGVLLPIGAKRVGLDPAVMASPFITTVVDTLTLLIYVAIASTVLHI